LKTLVFILLLLNPINVSNDYPLKHGKPTSNGIKRYVEVERDSLVIEYQKHINDTLFDVWIYAKDLTDYVNQDSLELGRYYPNEEIIISTAELFIAYELADLSNFKRALIEESNKFVKSTVFHELTHDYINQITREMQYVDKINVDMSYQTNIWIIKTHEMFGSTFIEEGLCEYMTENMGEIIPPKRVFIPKTIEDIMNRNNKYMVNYKYSSHYLKLFLDTIGFKVGVKILLHNSPPTYEEILKPDLFFSRLIKN